MSRFDPDLRHLLRTSNDKAPLAMGHEAPLALFQGGGGQALVYPSGHAPQRIASQKSDPERRVGPDCLCRTQGIKHVKEVYILERQGT